MGGRGPTTGLHPEPTADRPLREDGPVTVTSTTPVRYRGINYRSRLEAKWAALFHHLGWEATYQPYGDALPSFLAVQGNGERLFFAVTDAVTREEYAADQRNVDRILDRDDRPATDIAGLQPLAPGDLTWYGLDAEDVRIAWAKATNDISGLRS